MMQKEKELLLQDLCARLPYGVRYKGDGGWGINPYQHTTSLCTILASEEPLIYLRPLSSMTEEENKELRDKNILIAINTSGMVETTVDGFDWLNSHYFDYRGLIGKGLVLEAPEGMYNLKK